MAGKKRERERRKERAKKGNKQRRREENGELMVPYSLQPLGPDKVILPAKGSETSGV